MRRNNYKYTLKPSLRAEIDNMIRGYYDRKAELDAMLEETHQSDGIRSNAIGDPTGNLVAKLMNDRRYQKNEAIEQAIKMIPAEYREPMWDRWTKGIEYPLDFAHPNTWRHWHKVFRWWVAYYNGDLGGKKND